jgi:hypothetical protein
MIGNGDSFVNQLNAGIIIIIGVLAYKSAKKRKSKEVADTKLRLGFELAGILSIFLLVGMQNDVLKNIATEPLTNLALPIITFASYIYKAFIYKSK